MCLASVRLQVGRTLYSWARFTALSEMVAACLFEDSCGLGPGVGGEEGRGAIVS